MSSIRSTPALVAAAAATLCLSATGAYAASKPSTAKAAAAKTVTACVNKKSGATKVLLGRKAKKKCAKGWAKVTWNVAGANGTNGTNGINGINGANAVGLQVRDSAGTVLGTYAGLNPLAPVPVYVVLAPDGGLYNYLSNGELASSGFGLGASSPLFRDPECTGAAFYNTGVAPSSLLSLFVGQARLVYRSGDVSGLGTPRVWKFTSTTVTVPDPVPTLYKLDLTGACVVIAGGDFALPVAGNALIALATTPAPPVAVGPLTVG